jgi:hypothetical protein
MVRFRRAAACRKTNRQMHVQDIWVPLAFNHIQSTLHGTSASSDSSCTCIPSTIRFGDFHDINIIQNNPRIFTRLLYTAASVSEGASNDPVRPIVRNHIENRYFMASHCPERRIGVIHRTGAACCSTKVCEGLPVNDLVFINDFLPFGTRFWTIKMTQVATNRKLWKLDLFVCCVAFYLPCPLRSDRHIGSLMSK